MKNVLILEDNLQTAYTLEQIVKRIDARVQVAIAASSDNAYKIALEKSIDVFLIDIILKTDYPGDTSGIRFAQNLREIPKYYFTPLIFITALADPQLYAYRDIHCFGYIEKPFEVKQIKQLLERALCYKTPVNEEKKVYLRKEGILYSINLKRIVYIQVRNHIMNIYMENTEIDIPYKTIKLFLQENDCSDLIQCNRYSVINKMYIENIDLPNRYIKLKGRNVLVEIGLRYKKMFLESLNDHREY